MVVPASPRTGGRAVITELHRGRDAVRGEAGTTVVPA
jgi:carbamate kinase